MHLVDLRGLSVADQPLLDQCKLFGGRTLLVLVGGQARRQLAEALIESFGVRGRRGKLSETRRQLVGVDAALLQQTDSVAQGRQLVGHLGLRVDLRREEGQLAVQSVNHLGAAAELVKACSELVVGLGGRSGKLGDLVDPLRQQNELGDELGGKVDTTRIPAGTDRALCRGRLT